MDICKWDTWGCLLLPYRRVMMLLGSNHGCSWLLWEETCWGEGFEYDKYIIEEIAILQQSAEDVTSSTVLVNYYLLLYWLWISTSIRWTKFSTQTGMRWHCARERKRGNRSRSLWSWLYLYEKWKNWRNGYIKECWRSYKIPQKVTTKIANVVSSILPILHFLERKSSAVSDASGKEK